MSTAAEFCGLCLETEEREEKSYVCTTISCYLEAPSSRPRYVRTYTLFSHILACYDTFSNIPFRNIGVGGGVR
jgi:hypothetical protein